MNAPLITTLKASGGPGAATFLQQGPFRKVLQFITGLATRLRFVTRV